MKTNTLVLIGVLLASLDINRSTCLAQGALTPPGAPGPTMKSLDQIEARTPISSAPFTITQPGSYYLTTNVTVSSGNAISINVNNVTLDLNGFTISSTAAVASSDIGICLSGSLTNIAIRNGHIISGVTNNAGVYGGTGFGFGVIAPGFPYNVRVSDLSVSGCQYDGIYLGYNSTIVESCLVNTVGAYGIQAQTVSDSTANDCGATAIQATTANNCNGSSTGSGYGIYALGNAQNCYGYNSANGTGVFATTAENCYGYSATYIGVNVNNTALNCYGYSNGNGQGLDAGYAALNCYGQSNGNGDGISACTAQNCSGFSNSSTGVATTIAQNCFGSSTSSVGINSSIAENCYGASSGSGYGIIVDTASGCYGYSRSYIGLDAFLAIGCHGNTITGSDLAVMHNVNSF